jgi:HK97 family phage major capsid protein
VKTISELLEHLAALHTKAAAGEDVSGAVAEARTELEAIKAQAGGGGEGNEMEKAVENVLRHQRGGSRFPSPEASDQVLDLLAAGGSIPGLTVHGAKFASQGEGKSLAEAMTKAMGESTGAGGGFLVPVQIAGEVLRLVRAQSVIYNMGVTTTKVEKELDINAFASGATAAYVKEGENLPVSSPTIAQVPLLHPKEVGSMVPVNNRLLRHATSNPDLDAELRLEMAAIIAEKVDLAFLMGAGVDPEPLGLTKLAGLTAGPSLGANGAVPTYDNLIDTVAALRNVNAPFTKPGWVFNPKLLTLLQKVKDKDENYLAETGILTFDAAGTTGTLLGFPWRSTTKVPTNITTGTSTGNTTWALFSSDWNQVWVGEDQTLTIESNPGATYTTDGGTTWVSGWQARQTVFRAVTSNDIGARRPEFITSLTGIKLA